MGPLCLWQCLYVEIGARKGGKWVSCVNAAAAARATCNLLEDHFNFPPPISHLHPCSKLILVRWEYMTKANNNACLKMIKRCNDDQNSQRLRLLEEHRLLQS